MMRHYWFWALLVVFWVSLPLSSRLVDTAVSHLQLVENHDDVRTPASGDRMLWLIQVPAATTPGAADELIFDLPPGVIEVPSTNPSSFLPEAPMTMLFMVGAVILRHRLLAFA